MEDEDKKKDGRRPKRSEKCRQTGYEAARHDHELPSAKKKNTNHFNFVSII